ncbi:hypothetical protein AB0J90_02805 [Micromonospora sp. NPDC049523]|uniref:hypothetical protein n=1 Tax=Micromonospora sp. NPDC049523 TaxID=3155921 RepID=UPI003428D75A
MSSGNALKLLFERVLPGAGAIVSLVIVIIRLAGERAANKVDGEFIGAQFFVGATGLWFVYSAIAPPDEEGVIFDMGNSRVWAYVFLVAGLLLLLVSVVAWVDAAGSAAAQGAG